jgi:hypothetical protein
MTGYSAGSVQRIAHPCREARVAPKQLLQEHLLLMMINDDDDEMR